MKLIEHNKRLTEFPVLPEGLTEISLFNNEIEIISEIEDACRVSAKIHSGNTVFLRFKGVYTFT